MNDEVLKDVLLDNLNEIKKMALEIKPGVSLDELYDMASAIVEECDAIIEEINYKGE